jgi:hypothetical protein
MDGSTRLRRQVLPIGRCFKGSRLEVALLASAFEQAVPLLRRRGRGPRPRATDDARPAAEPEPRAITGG